MTANSNAVGTKPSVGDEILVSISGIPITKKEALLLTLGLLLNKVLK